MSDANVKRLGAGLPPELERLLTDYVDHCRQSGLRESSIELCLKIDRWFLENLSAVGCETAEQVNAKNVAAASLALKSNYYLSTVKTFLRVLAEMGRTDRDYSGVVPTFKRPQPMPTVYSESEIKKFENQVREHSSKRNYAIILLATRLGIRSGDIARMKLSDIDFHAETVRVAQQKTAAEVKLPLVPELKAALRDYLENSRPDCDSAYVFVREKEPYSDQPLTIMYIGNMVRRHLVYAGIEKGGRKSGPHSFRSSLASSMVNDGISYEAVRKALGHTDPNAIKSYAKLDVGKLKAYALAVPKATGGFAKLLSGKAVL
jgi:integrase